MSHRKRHRSAIYGINRSRLHMAQPPICALCGERFTRNRPATAEHVFPKRMVPWRGLGNAVLAHSDCNGRKADKEPTPCLIIWLMGVNARLGVPMPTYHIVR